MIVAKVRNHSNSNEYNWKYKDSKEASDDLFHFLCTSVFNSSLSGYTSDSLFTALHQILIMESTTEEIAAPMGEVAWRDDALLDVCWYLCGVI